MYIDRIILNNFRIYKGQNQIDLSVTGDKNVAIITGSNGFGKTSLLTSLVWCLYGKLMGDVEERYRKEIHESGGYKNYCTKFMNRKALDENDSALKTLAEQSEASTIKEKELINKQIKQNYCFSVNIRFKKIFIPAIPCNDLEIVRTYNINTHTETLTVHIDGQPNELTKDVGPEIFINDFILRKEIAKFFFFDAEKIVDLAEVKSIEDKRSLGQAYSEVLGIKKYLNLKHDLENLRQRLSKKNATGADRQRLDKLIKQKSDNEKMLEHHQTFINEKHDELLVKKSASDKFQERLIREGSSISLEEINDFRIMREQLQETNGRLKARMKDMMELAPLAIAASQMEKIKTQIESEQNENDTQNNDALLKRKSTAIKTAITKSNIRLTDANKKLLYDLVEKVLLPDGVYLFKPLLDLSNQQQNSFLAVYDNLHDAFSKNFKSLATELKIQQTSLTIINRKLADAESNEKDPIVSAIRTDKTKLDEEIQKIETEIINLKAKSLSLNNDQASIASQISELTKKVSNEDKDKAKDEVAARIIGELDAFIYRLKITKKHSLEERILNELNILMHKRNFVHKVEVIIQGDLIDIELYDYTERKINKGSLSKGEQQLYATALLKALVDESNIHFPVFIDSPLQKFDKEHAKNIILDFYPNVSAQVILFPLLEKELNKEEFQLLFPRVSNCYTIEHTAQYESIFKEVNPTELYNNIYQTV